MPQERYVSYSDELPFAVSSTIVDSTFKYILEQLHESGTNDGAHIGNRLSEAISTKSRGKEHRNSLRCEYQHGLVENKPLND